LWLAGSSEAEGRTQLPVHRLVEQVSCLRAARGLEGYRAMGQSINGACTWPVLTRLCLKVLVLAIHEHQNTQPGLCSQAFV
jgi:hypothetical protein